MKSYIARSAMSDDVCYILYLSVGKLNHIKVRMTSDITDISISATTLFISS